MILTYKKYNMSFELYSNRLNEIVIENPVCFENFIVDLYQQISKDAELFLLSDDETIIKIEKAVEMILSPVDLQYDKKIIQKKLYADIMHQMEITGTYDEIIEMYGNIIELLQLISLQIEPRITFSDAIGVANVLKYFDVHIDNPEGTFCEKLIEYGSNVKAFSDKNILVIANCNHYLSSEDYFHLEKWSKYYDNYIIFVNGMQSCCNDNVNQYIIDNDLCLIY